MTQLKRKASHAYVERAGGDVESLVRDNLALVRRVAWHTHSRVSGAIELADLVQIGLTALVEAAQTFEDRGVAFSSYAVVRIRGAMIDACRRLSALSRANMVQRRKIVATRRRLEQTHCRIPTDVEMATALGVEACDYSAMLRDTVDVSYEHLDATYSDKSMAFASDSAGPEAELDRTALAGTLAKLIEALSHREALVLNLYFREEMNLKEIGDTLGLTAARVCQIKQSAIGKLRGSLPGVFQDYVLT